MAKKDKNTEAQELFDLETLITEGMDARVPIEIEFPDGRKAAAMIRPLNANEFKTIYDGDASNILISILEKSLMNKNGDALPRSLIEAMPIGLPAKIIKQIFEISGVETTEEDTNELINNLNLFPWLQKRKTKTFNLNEFRRV